MALKVSADAQLVFFSKVFGADHPVVAKVSVMLNAGATFEVGLYTIKAKTGGGQFTTVDLTVSTSALVKGMVPSAAVFMQNHKLIQTWIEGLHWFPSKPVEDHPVEPPPTPVQVLPSELEHKTLMLMGIAPKKRLPVIKAVYQILGGGDVVSLKAVGTLVAEAEHALTAIKTFNTHAEAEDAQFKLKAAGGVHVVLSALGQATAVDVMLPVKAQPVDAVVDLKAAHAIGQKVHGTSKGSVYYTVAISEQGVKVAARLYQSGAISIRAEWEQGQLLTGIQAELTKLEAAGLNMKSKGYGSIHFDAAGVPLPRVVGAFLIGTGIKWTDMVTNGEEFVVTGG